MELSANKLFLPPLSKAPKLDNTVRGRGSSVKSREARFPGNVEKDPKQANQNVDRLNLRKTDDVSEAVEMPLAPQSQTEQKSSSEPLKLNLLQKVPQQQATSVTTMPLQVKRTLSLSQKTTEIVVQSKRRIIDTQKSRAKSKGHGQKENQKSAVSSTVAKISEPVRTLEDISDDDDYRIEEEMDEIDEKDMQEAVQQIETKKKKKKPITQLKDMVPLNLENERKKFFELNFQYDPQFEYNIEELNQKFNEPHKAYLQIAENILDLVNKEFGDDDAYIEKTGGKISNEEEITEQYTKYVKELGLENRLELIFSHKIVSSASCWYKGKGKGAILVSLPVTHREKRVLSLFHHEIGTHFVRKINERKQPWAGYRNQYNLKGCLVIEEGLAMLNQTLDDAFDPERKPYLYGAAIHYYACYKSSLMSFQELFQDLEKYIKDPMRRWKECIRVKRGLSDTSKPGGMYKDQVYLRGSVKILQNRSKIDFVLLHMGKLNLEDLQRMIKSGLVKTDKMKVPHFLKDLDKYKAALDRIASFNLIEDGV